MNSKMEYLFDLWVLIVPELVKVSAAAYYYRDSEIAITGIVTVNYYYLLLETPGSVITSKNSQKSLVVMFLKQVFSPEFLYSQFTTSLHSIHVLKFYTITVLG